MRCMLRVDVHTVCRISAPVGTPANANPVVGIPYIAGLPSAVYVRDVPIVLLLAYQLLLAFLLLLVPLVLLASLLLHSSLLLLAFCC